MLYMPETEASWLEGDQWSNFDTSVANAAKPRHPA
jgi:hypothetical protein